MAVIITYAIWNAEAQKKSLQKLMKQKSHSFTGGVPPGRFEDLCTAASPAGKQWVAKRFDDVISGYQSPKQAVQKLAGQPTSISAAMVTNAESGSPCIGSDFDKVEVGRQPQQKLAHTLMSQAVYRSAAQQVAEHCQLGLPQTYIGTDTLPETHASTTQALAEQYSHTHMSAQRDESTPLASCISTTAISKQVRREYEALVADESQPAAGTAAEVAASAVKGVSSGSEPTRLVWDSVRQPWHVHRTIRSHYHLCCMSKCDAYMHV